MASNTWPTWTEGATTTSCDTTTYSGYTWVTWSANAGVCVTGSQDNVTYIDCTFIDWSEAATVATTTSASTTWVGWSGNQGECFIEASIYEPDAYEKLKAEKEAAEEKAKELLLDLIGSDEMKIYRETGRLFVKGAKYDYIVQREGFVKRVEKDKITDMCVHLRDKYKYPPTDNVIAIKTSLEHEEDNVLEMANYHSSEDRPEELPIAACM